jgi:hypothetical protein
MRLQAVNFDLRLRVPKHTVVGARTLDGRREKEIEEE